MDAVDNVTPRIFIRTRALATAQMCYQIRYMLAIDVVFVSLLFEEFLGMCFMSLKLAVEYPGAKPTRSRFRPPTIYKPYISGIGKMENGLHGTQLLRENYGSEVYCNLYASKALCLLT